MTETNGHMAQYAAHELRDWIKQHRHEPGARKVWWRGKETPQTSELGRGIAFEAMRHHAEGVVNLRVLGDAGTARRRYIVEIAE